MSFMQLLLDEDITDKQLLEAAESGETEAMMGLPTDSELLCDVTVLEDRNCIDPGSISDSELLHDMTVLEIGMQDSLLWIDISDLQLLADVEEVEDINKLWDEDISSS